MKKIVLLLLLFTISSFANAQEKGKFRGGMDLGYAIPSGGGGVMFALEVKYNLADNMNVGVRYSSAALAKTIEPSGDGESVEASVSANTGIIGTYDYYFSSGSSAFAPFVGGGIGYFQVAAAGVNSTSNLDLDNIDNANFGVAAESKLGGVIRAGFELGKFRTTLQYNLIPKTEASNVVIKNSYIGVTLGFYVGGGKWKK